MRDIPISAHKALQNARIAYQSGNYQAARLFAQQAVQIAPEIEESWLWLAAVSHPRASIEYISQALKINPSSQRARKAMHWAVQRLRAVEPAQPRRRIVDPSIPSSEYIFTKSRINIIPISLVAIVLVLVAFLYWFVGAPRFSMINVSAFSGNKQLLAGNFDINKSTRTPTPTFTPSPTFTPLPTSTSTETPTSLPTETPEPTFTPEPIVVDEDPGAYQIPYLPDVGNNGRWIDVDLSNQITYAYEGDVLVRSFIVSTGTWQYPTVTGQYYIYVKYVSAPMSGPGYYLPGVPYIMYFYDGYGLHGTYWHDNFGTPMSHGCINLTISDAEWLYYWSSIGTLVNIHY
jgi:lipoprotein-anchoring transpeptidase ErfK/SrfK